MAQDTEGRSDWFGRFGDDVPFDGGPCQEILVGHSRNDAILTRAASGGFVTSLIEYMLQKRLADGALVTVPDRENPRYGRFTLVHEPRELLSAASSIYSMVPLQKDVADILRTASGQKLVLVGRPCQIRAIERLRPLLPSLSDQIALTVSVFCAWSISQEGVDFLTQMAGIRRGEPLRSIDYRKGIWPGNFSATTDQGEKFFPFYQNDHFSGVYYYPALISFVPPECTFCTDVLGARADISVGDAWNLGMKPGSHGYSIAVIRTQRALNTIRGGTFTDTHFTVDKIVSPKDLAASQGNTVRLKSSGVLASHRLTVRSRSLFLFTLFNRLGALLIRLKLQNGCFNGLFAVYLRVFWSRYRRRSFSSKRP